MCRNIRVLHHFQPPTTKDEMRAAALQYVRKVAGTTKPPAVDEATFARAVDEVARATEKLLAQLHAPKAPARTREGEKEKAKARWKKRETRIQSS
ncbi:MAG TPA: DUF2277 domain-containing protein [Polyangiaceae bacterium]|jgi:hypothetical protein